MILTAGPSISQKEVDYVSDAAKNGWNEHWSDYLHKFEKAFAEYIGVKYAMATSGGTGALHLGLASMGIGPGDEVIIPEITYFACSDVTVLLGAKPVFVDVLPDTWCIDPQAVERAITPRTKAIMPVHIYGNPAEMDQIMKIAHKHHLRVIEDACPAVGAVFKGHRPGSYGDFGAFSFQGAKIMVTGTGGMLVTNDKKLFERAQYLNNHGEELGKKFFQTSIGFSFEMSNLQAAFGLAQLERIEEFVDKKRQIFDWYFEQLGSIPGITMNAERPDTKSNRWMSSIIFDDSLGIDRDEFRQRMKNEEVDTRPFFYPISQFPMFTEQDTPVAHHVAEQGINLPSGLMLTKKQVDFVCSKVKKVLKTML
jgi:perosamine synthetase